MAASWSASSYVPFPGANPGYQPRADGAGWDSRSYPTGSSRIAQGYQNAMQQSQVAVPPQLPGGFATQPIPRQYGYYPPRQSSLSTQYGPQAGPSMPVPSMINMPSASIPAYPSPEQGDYFSQPLRFPEPRVAPRLRYAQSAPPPPLPRKPSDDINHPPLPPKPSYSFPAAGYSHRSSSLDSFSRDPSTSQARRPTLPPNVSEEDEDEELRQVLHLSLQESEAQKHRVMQEEDEALALAMRESLAHSQAHTHEVPAADGAGIHRSPGSSPRSHGISQRQSPRHPAVPARPHPPMHRKSSSITISTPMFPPSAPESPDIARQLQFRSTMPEMVLEHPRAHARKLPQPTPYPGSQMSPLPNTQDAPSPLGERQHLSASNGDSAAAPLSTSPSHSPDSRCRPLPQHLIAQENSGESDGDSGDNSQGDHSPVRQVAFPHESEPQPMPVCQQRLIPQQLLRGVSMGVGVPSISASLRPMQTEIPTVIQLTYDKKAPFHIRGPNWRSLLKLMAMMGSTRIEPSTETIANATKDIRLRVVVSFVKVHSTSPEWNTVLYISMDRPVKSDTPNAQRYRNGDTTMLPWSYTLTAPPAVLRDGADAAMSKFYTVPNTPGNLYPTLPISMPDLATYLATALDVSRNGAHEGIPGLRRLSKLIDSIYPLDQIELDDEKRGMRQKLKSFVGLGSKPSRSRNDQTYDLVTPFVPDEFGR